MSRSLDFSSAFVLLATLVACSEPEASRSGDGGDAGSGGTFFPTIGSGGSTGGLGGAGGATTGSTGGGGSDVPQAPPCAQYPCYLASAPTRASQPTADSTHVYWLQEAGSTASVLRTDDGAGQPIETVVPTSESVEQFIVGTSFVYFSTPTAIKRVPKSGGAATQLASDHCAYELLQDDTHIYWFNDALAARRVSKNGGAIEELLSLPTMHGYARVASGWFYYPAKLDMNSTAVPMMRIPVDASGMPEQFLGGQWTWTTETAVNSTGFYFEAGVTVGDIAIYYSTHDTPLEIELLNNLSRVQELVATEQYLFWMDSVMRRMLRMQLPNGNPGYIECDEEPTAMGGFGATQVWVENEIDVWVAKYDALNS
jgi:hypothetical protein